MSLVLLAPAGAVAALLFAAYLATGMLKNPEGTEIMKKISASVRKGANAFLVRQYKTVGIFFACMVVILTVLAFLGLLPSPFVPVAFLTGGFYSGLAGFVGMKVATNANSRTAEACSKGLNGGLRVAFTSGAVMGLAVVGLGLLDLSTWYFVLTWYYTSVDPLSAAERITKVANTMLTFGVGASSMALFARVGGGIFTKAADVGADLVGKVEAGIPEDDPRNPAVIADNVGDNVGDVAGMGADLYESYVGSIIAAASLAASAFIAQGADITVKAVTIPLIIAAIGVFSSILGTFLVSTKENASQGDLLFALRRGVYGSSVLIVVVAFLVINFWLGSDYMGVFWAILSGLLAGNLIGFTTEYYTSAAYKPTKNLAESSKTGPATIIIGGLSLGMVSTAIPVVIIGVAVLASYAFMGGFGGSANDVAMGLYGVSVAAVGMLSTLGITLATDAYGPIADNAGGIAEMAGLDHSVRERTDALDSLGNTTAATGKGFAIGSAALTALALIVAYTQQVDDIAIREGLGNVLDLRLTNPPVLIGLFVGSMIAFVFAAFTMSAVNRAAQGIVNEVRRQFREIAGLLEGKEGVEADYATCVDICTKSAQKEMIVPALLGVIGPICVGMILGVNGVVGMLGGALVTGFALALMMANGGGAWDNAKKYIEAGNLGGKGSDNHKAAVVGDTVGDPFKDTSGPSINVLIKLLSMVSIVFASVVLHYSLLDNLLR